MKNRFDHARGWFLKAESDLITVKRMLEGGGPYDTACFHTQQAVERYLKGFLAFKEEPIPHTHNLEELYRLCIVSAPVWPFTEVDLAELTPYAVQLRYDFEFWPDRTTTEHALYLAEQVRTAILVAIPKEAHPRVKQQEP